MKVRLLERVRFCLGDRLRLLFSPGVRMVNLLFEAKMASKLGAVCWWSGAALPRSAPRLFRSFLRGGGQTISQNRRLRVKKLGLQALKTFGSKKLSRDQSSARLFYNGVPVRRSLGVIMRILPVVALILLPQNQGEFASRVFHPVTFVHDYILKCIILQFTFHSNRLSANLSFKIYS